ncbi:MAG: hypothetical protein ACK5GN_10760 [Pseudomonadota bacterium]
MRSLFLVLQLLSSALILLVFRLGYGQQPAAKPEAEDLCSLSQLALREASKVRELTTLSPVPCVVEDRPAVTRFIQDTIREDLPPHKLANEEIAYRAVGLIPDSFDYQKGLVEFLVSQIGGYYNPKKKLFVMAGWLPAVVQGGVAVHELTHALQDQHYNLKEIMNVREATTDSGLAASALVEGDASAVMFDYERSKSGEGSLRSLASVESMLLLQVLGLGVSGEVPESLKSLLIFPYTSGLRFVHSLLRDGGYASVNRAYSRIPSTTREILHPSDYLSGPFTAKIPSDSELEGAPSGVAAEYTDVLGEFGISSIFRGSAATKDRGPGAAAGWIGDKLGIFPGKDGQRVVSWLTRWETEKDASEFVSLYREYLTGVYGVPIGVSETVLSKGRKITVSQKGADVSLVLQEVALPQPSALKP